MRQDFSALPLAYSPHRLRQHVTLFLYPTRNIEGHDGLLLFQNILRDATPEMRISAYATDYNPIR
jgi:hypothetical protein